jgi:uncharacterized protein YbjT (DUF2867 family)
MTILVTGARGHVSRSLIRRLLADGRRVRAAGRAPEQAGLPAGVEVVRADLADAETLRPALAGVRVVFLYVVPGGWEGVLARAREAGVEHVVLLSARGADAASGDAITRVHGEAERAVARSGIAWTFLRPGGFATNRLWWAGTIRGEGVVRDPFPDSRSALIHEDDIAAVAARALTEAGHIGVVHTLTGPESLTVRRQAELIGEAIGRPVRVESQDLDDYRRTLSRLPPEIAEARIRRLAALVERDDPTTDTVRRVTGRPPRTFAEWAADHAPDFEVARGDRVVVARSRGSVRED